MKAKPTFFERFLARLKAHPAVSMLVALGGVIIALSSFTDAAKNLVDLFNPPNPEEARASLARLSVPYTPAAFVAAAAEGDVTVVQLFLTAGMNPDTPAYFELRAERLPALAAAAYENHVEVVSLLLKSRASVVTPHYNSLVAGAVSGNTEILRQMLKQSFEPEQLEEAFVVAESRPILEELERAGVDVSKVGLEAMRQATSADAVNFLTERGIDVDARDSQGKMVIQHLMDNNFFTSAEAVLALIDHGADINACDRHGSTLLLRAVHNGNIAMVENLLRRKANITVRDADDRPALSLSTEAGGKRGLQIAGLLLTHGADINARDRDGKTALHHAAAKGDVAFVRLLVQHKADVHARDQKGNTALALAQNSRSSEAPEVTRLLRENGATAE